MKAPSDQLNRDRFRKELETNFSVIAPAGVGKTSAIVSRIIEMATRDNAYAMEQLPRLVVVTYTRKAAAEMHQRARNAIIAQKPAPGLLAQFNRAFFGTIHSFCLNLLGQHRHHIGLPAAIDVLRNDDALWLEFIRQYDEVGGELSAGIRGACLRHVSAEQILKLARQFESLTAVHDIPEQPPVPDLEALYAHTNNRARKGIEEGHRVLRQWEAALSSNAPYVPVPKFKKGGKDFVPLWKETFKPLNQWLARASWSMARDLASAFHEYRQSQGCLTFDDQIRLTRELLLHEQAGHEIREAGYRVILDEAQDTDPAQFDVLLEATRPPEATGYWTKNGGLPPQPGHFCMVGDPQQSIYGRRADLRTYSAIRKQLADAPAGEELTFEVTFRCGSAIIDAVNRLAPSMLDGSNGQASFVPLKARPEPHAGQVTLWRPEIPADFNPKDPVDDRSQIEAMRFSRWLAETGPENLRASAWLQVAILCPRTKWIAIYQQALHECGLASQVHSNRDQRADSPAYAWLTAITRVTLEPDNHYEIVGILREVYGCSDQALYEFARGDGRRFQIIEPTPGKGPVEGALQTLAATRNVALSLPLRDAVATLIDLSELRDRIATLRDDSGELLLELDQLLTQSAGIETRNGAMEDWLEYLEDGFEEVIDEKPVERDAVQLITSHKAKGLEWDAVILPLLYRDIGERPPEYPMAIPGTPGNPPEVVFDKAGWEALKESLQRRKRQETQRLLYVALTRARHTLILIDDASLFSKRSQSFADALGLEKEPLSAQVQAVAQLSAVGPEPADHPKAIEHAALDPLDPQILKRAVKQSAAFIHRILPHALAEHPLPEEPEQNLDPDPESEARGLFAREYGTWWHETMERIDWSGLPEAWNNTLEQRLASCADPERGRREWQLLLPSDFAKVLSKPCHILQQEIPILWRRDEYTCVEGLVDLALLDEGAGRWMVVDWKTNMVAPDEAESLRDIYRLQIGAYTEALRAISGLEADGYVYSTVTGQLISCS